MNYETLRSEWMASQNPSWAEWLVGKCIALNSGAQPPRADNNASPTLPVECDHEWVSCAAVKCERCGAVVED